MKTLRPQNATQSCYPEDLSTQQELHYPRVERLRRRRSTDYEAIEAQGPRELRRKFQTKAPGVSQPEKAVKRQRLR